MKKFRLFATIYNPLTGNSMETPLAPAMIESENYADVWKKIDPDEINQSMFGGIVLTAIRIEEIENT